MQIIRSATEDEMILNFLKGELNSARFSDALRRIMQNRGVALELIEAGDLCSEKQNAVRRLVLQEFRGYPDREIFENYPGNVRWSLVCFDGSDLDKLRYVDYCYWNELSNNTSRPTVAASEIRNGKIVYDVPNTEFLSAMEALRNGNTFPPIILLGSGNDVFLILEGHLRATAYALCPEKFEGTYGYVGFCSEQDMAKKTGKQCGRAAT